MATEQAWEGYGDQSFLATNDTILARTSIGGGVEILSKHIFAARSAGGAADIEVNGAVRATIDASGRLGLGRTPTANMLEVAGTIGAYSGSNYTAIYNNGTDGFAQTTVGSMIYQVPATGTHIFQINAVNMVRINASGDLLSIGGGGVGYGTGAGGAVTQITSRTTGVTLNTASGGITLVSAAGSTSWQSFTVTNSKVAATDIVHVCQKSGTDLYEIHVTNVAAGSFKISFRTTSGTTTEQPVFNFAIIKGATS